MGWHDKDKVLYVMRSWEYEVTKRGMVTRMFEKFLMISLKKHMVC